MRLATAKDIEQSRQRILADLDALRDEYDRIEALNKRLKRLLSIFVEKAGEVPISKDVYKQAMLAIEAD